MALDVVVSVVSHDQPTLLRTCVESLAAACGDLRWSAEVTLNLPDPESERWLAAEVPEAVVHTNAVPRGFGANHNRALHAAVAANARHLVVLNDDTVVEPGAIAAMVEQLDRHPELGAVGPTVVGPGGRRAVTRLRYPTLGMALRMDLGRHFERADPDGWLQGACTAFRVEAVAAVGGYDERYFLFFEDCDLSLRLRRAGWDLGDCPGAVVVHAGHATVLRDDLVAATRKHGQRSRYLYYREHFGPVRTALVTGAGRLALAVRGLAALARRRPEGRGLLALARYDPATPQPVEIAARPGEVAPS